MTTKSIRKYKNLRGKKVLYRADLNVPIKKGHISDDYKIIQHLPTIRFLLRYNCSIIIVTHLGRPKGRVRADLSIKPIAAKLSQLLGRPVEALSHPRGLKVSNRISQIKKGEIIMPENIRFDPGEEKNSSKLAKELAGWADLMVMDAFGVSHRRQASLAAIHKYIPSFSGLLLDKEIEHLQKAFNGEKPLVILIGGAKIDTKTAMIKKMMNKAHKILLGGGVANTFLAARGYEAGKSLVDRENISIARKLKQDKIILPQDFIVSAKKSDASATQTKRFNKVDKNDYIFDIGPKTIRLYSSLIKEANTVIWNGPMGMFEIKEFKHGTAALSSVVASRSMGKAFGVVGGGETISALRMSQMFDYIDWVSTGGGAMLAFLAREKMPALKGLIK